MPGKIVSTVKSLVKNKALPYNYIVGEKSTGKGLPFDVKLSVDPDFKKTIIKTVTIFSVGVGLGIVAGFVVTRKK